MSVSWCHTFIMYTEVVLRESDVAELVLWAPGARKRSLIFINGWIEPSESLVELLFLLVQNRVSVDNNRHQKPTARRLSRHGYDTSFTKLACQEQARATCVSQCQVFLKGGFFLFFFSKAS